LIVSAELERAVLHTLQKNPDQRTASVEVMIDELREAIVPGAQFLSTARTLPVSTLKIITKPPKSSVFVDNVAVGQTMDNGLLLLEGLQSGNHHLRVSHAGFQDWLRDVVSDGKPLEVVAELTAGAFDSRTAIPMPDITVGGGQKTIANSRQGTDDMDQTVQQNWHPGRIDVLVDSTPPKKKSGLSALIFGIGGLLGVFLLVIIGVGAAYMLGAFGPRGTGGPGNVANTPTPAPTVEIPISTQMEMIPIPGGKFTMGRNVEPYEYGEHTVQVSNFSIGKTEVTNAQYQEFVTAKGHVPPKHWPSGVPIKGTEMKPVSFVSMEDATAFAKWLSQKEGGTYRLPTEQEWEYVARNGSKQNLFPWGDDWIDGNAVMGRSDAEPAVVGSKPQGANIWGVLDLIGNVYEWTSTEYYRYPGSEAKVAIDKAMEKDLKGRIIARGGSADVDPNKERITSTYRAFVPADTKNKILGFRLVKEN